MAGFNEHCEEHLTYIKTGNFLSNCKLFKEDSLP